METLFGELPVAARFFIAFLIVLALIVLTFWAIRRFGGIGLGAGATRGRQPRLGVIDAAVVDGRRRLVLIRRDNVEHLLMIGGLSDIVVEQNIVRPAAAESQGRTTEVPVRSAPPITPGARPAPEPTVSPQARPGPPASDAELTDMAQRLEAALRRPVAPGPARTEPVLAGPRPVPESGARAASEAGPRPSPLPFGAPPAAREAPKPAAPKPEPPRVVVATEPAQSAQPEAKPKSVLDSLEQEMASLLGRPLGKP